MKKPKFGKTGRESGRKGQKFKPPSKGIEQPKSLSGKLKQTEGYTPNSAMPSSNKAGGSRGSKAREKRLAGLPM